MPGTYADTRYFIKSEGILHMTFRCSQKAEFYRILGLVKTMPGRSFEPKTQTWHAPVTPLALEILCELGFRNQTPNTTTILAQQEPPVKEAKVVEIPGLFPFQNEGVSWLESRDGIGILADEMGLGKTCQIISYFNLFKDIPILICCPSSLKPNWKAEIIKWGGGDDIRILTGRSPTLFSPGRWTIINYDILSGWADTLADLPFQGIAFDESHRINNKKAQRTKAAVQLAKEFPRKIFASGTPIKNRPSEFWVPLSIVAPKVFSNHWKFLNRYCAPKHNGFGWTFNGATNIDELRELVKPFILRRLKTEVLKDLPPKMKNAVSLAVDPDGWRRYKDAETAFTDWVEGAEKRAKLEIREHMEHLKQAAYMAKRESVMEWIEGVVEAGKKLVVFATHIDVLRDLQARFPGIHTMIDGSVKDRKAPVDRFQNDPSCLLFIGQTQAAGEGITLTAADALAFVEFPWTPGDAEQCEDRIHRIGQVSESVSIYYLMAEGTIDIDIVQMLVSKNVVTKKLLSGMEDAQFFGDDPVAEAILAKVKKNKGGKK